jgi:hypothetical protein
VQLIKEGSMDLYFSPDYYFEGGPSMYNTIQGPDLIKNEQAILDALQHAKETGTMIGIHAPVLGTGTYITGIVDIRITDYETIVVTKGYDVTGYFLDKSSLKLGEIKSVIPFTSIFINPFLRINKKETE